MRIGFRKILRDLWRSKGRTLLAVLSIAVGVFAVGMVSGMRDFVPARMMSSYRESSPAHVTIILSGIVTNDDLARLARVPGVLDIEGVRRLGARWQPVPNAPLRNVSIAVRPDYADQKFNTITLLRGTWPDRDGIAVEQSTVDTFRMPRSGTLTLLVDEREREFKIIGVVQDFDALPPAVGGPPPLYVSPEMAETVFGVRGYSRLRVQVPVAVGPLALEGVVRSVHGRDAEVDIRGKRLRASLDEIRLVGNDGPAPRVSVSVQIETREGSSSELNVIGCRVDKAVARVDKFIDAALIAELRSVRIIHGHGTGQLRRAIGEFLQDHPLVARMGPAPAEHGGSGVTVVELKE